MPLSRTRLGDKIFEALVCLRHNAAQIRAWAIHEQKIPEVIAHPVAHDDIDAHDVKEEQGTTQDSTIIAHTLRMVQPNMK